MPALRLRGRHRNPTRRGRVATLRSKISTAAGRASASPDIRRQFLPHSLADLLSFPPCKIAHPAHLAAPASTAVAPTPSPFKPLIPAICPHSAIQGD